MQSTLRELLPRWEVGFLISVFAIGFFVTLLSIATMVADANASESYCREYQTEITIAGKRQQAYGTACRKPDGAWQIQRDAAGNTKLALAQVPPAAAGPSVIVVPVPADDAAFFDGDLFVVEDWTEEPEILFYEGTSTHIILDGEEVLVAEEPDAIVLMEEGFNDEIIILD